MVSRDGERTASAELWELLTRKGPVRDKWEKGAREHGLRVTFGEVNSQAVGLVLDTYSGTRASRHVAPNGRRWKDRIHRIKAKKEMSTATLEAFIAAFDFEEQIAARLRALHSGELGGGGCG